MKLFWKKDPRKKKTKPVKKKPLSADQAAEDMRERNKKYKEMLDEAGK